MTDEKIKLFTDLPAWKKAYLFVEDIYGDSQKFPQKDLYGLVSPFRRAAVSIPKKIEQGFKKEYKKDKAKYMHMAEDSIEECRYHILISHDLPQKTKRILLEELTEISNLLDEYTSSLLAEIAKEEKRLAAQRAKEEAEKEKKLKDKGVVS